MLVAVLVMVLVMVPLPDDELVPPDLEHVRPGLDLREDRFWYEGALNLLSLLRSLGLGS